MGGRGTQGVGVGDVLTQLFAFTGSTLTVSGMGYAEATLPQLDGRDLADVLGNFVNRILKFTEARFEGVVPAGGEPAIRLQIRARPRRQCDAAVTRHQRLAQRTLHAHTHAGKAG